MPFAVRRFPFKTLFHHFPQDTGGVAAGGRAEGQPKVASFSAKRRFAEGNPQRPAASFHAQGTGKGESFQAQDFLPEYPFFQGTGCPGSEQHLTAEKRRRRTDLESVGA